MRTRIALLLAMLLVLPLVAGAQQWAISGGGGVLSSKTLGEEVPAPFLQGTGTLRARWWGAEGNLLYSPVNKNQQTCKLNFPTKVCSIDARGNLVTLQGVGRFYPHRRLFAEAGAHYVRRGFGSGVFKNTTHPIVGGGVHLGNSMVRGTYFIPEDSTANSQSGVVGQFRTDLYGGDNSRLGMRLETSVGAVFFTDGFGADRTGWLVRQYFGLVLRR